MKTFDVVVSADNNPYIEWQTMLFHHSCVRQLGRAPIVVVHGEGGLREGYRLIEQAGGRIQRAPSFRSVGGGDYPPRNAAGTLACVETTAERVVLCDPDMIFLRNEPFVRLDGGEIGVERSTFLRVNRENRNSLALACRRAGVRLETLEADPLEAGVPIVIPAELREPLAREWLACIDLLLGLPRSDAFVRSLLWLTSMWGFVLAVRRFGLRTVTTRLAVANERGAPPLTDDPRKLPALLHYAYGDAVFEKRDFHGAPEICERVWQLERVEEPSLGARIRDEIAAARSLYGLEPTRAGVPEAPAPPAAAVTSPR